MYTSAFTGKVINNLKPLLEAKVRTYLQNIVIEPGKPDVDLIIPDQIMVPLKFRYMEDPAQRITVRFNIPGNPERELENGSAFLFLYTQPSKLEESYEVIYKLKFEAEPDLTAIEKEFAIQETKKVKVNFTEIMKIDFRITKMNDGFLKFSPSLENISIAKLRWNFGDSSTSEEYDPIHKYLREGVYKVNLLINENAGLSKSLLIDHLGNILENTQTDTVKVKKEKIQEKEELNSTLSFLLKEIKEKSAKEILQLLVSLKLSGSIIYGRQSSFPNPDSCYVIIYNEDAGSINALLSPARPYRINLLDKKKVNDISTDFRNMRAIWLEIY
jgi:hypothetical protein